MMPSRSGRPPMSPARVTASPVVVVTTTREAAATTTRVVEEATAAAEEEATVAAAEVAGSKEAAQARIETGSVLKNHTSGCGGKKCHNEEEELLLF
mmetsp:Transcript_34772/g.76103  ORF Transcript_34772/g.76103 Transcript_34772/m.76103 type:complete len:96 (+) Transcript_34772:263-550(+)